MANVRKRDNRIRLVNAAAKAASKNPVVSRVSPSGFPKYVVRRLLHNSAAALAAPQLFERALDHGGESSDENTPTCLLGKYPEAKRIKIRDTSKANGKETDTGEEYGPYKNHESGVSERLLVLNERHISQHMQRETGRVYHKEILRISSV